MNLETLLAIPCDLGEGESAFDAMLTRNQVLNDVLTGKRPFGDYLDAIECTTEEQVEEYLDAVEGNLEFVIRNGIYVC